MKLIAFALTAACAFAALPTETAIAADYSGSYQRERVYRRPVPRVYYAPVRPTAVCRVGYLKEKSWPRERHHTVRCVDFH